MSTIARCLGNLQKSRIAALQSAANELGQGVLVPENPLRGVAASF
jgi:hypothetical protein